MTLHELHSAGAKLYGNGLINRVYIQALAKDLQKPETTIRRWWYGLNPAIPQETQTKLQTIQMERGRF